MIKKSTILLFSALAAVLLLATGALAASDAWETPGNTDLNIQNGGTMLLTEDTFYYSKDSGIFAETTAGVRQLSTAKAGNLNLRGDLLYYTLEDGSVHSLSLKNGKDSTVYKHSEKIKQLYVIGDQLRFLSGGRVFAYDMQTDTLTQRGSLQNVIKLLPTEYGDICLTGTVLDYDLYAGEKAVLHHVESAYTDSGWLVLSQEEEDYQIGLSDLFSGKLVLQEFDLHGQQDATELLGELAEEDCEYCKENAQEVSLLDTPAAGSGGDVPGAVIPTVSQGQKNMVRRARQLLEIQWTPLIDRYQWGYRGTFTAGNTISGLPYGQPVNNGGYVGYNVSLEKFAAAVADSTSVFYTTYSTYNKIAPAYSTDCSGFVSYAWQLKNRTTTYGWANVATKVSDQSVYSVQVGDALNHTTSHIVMVSDVKYDSEGNLIQVTIVEETPVKTKTTVYGQGGAYDLSRIQSYYLSGGYAIYRLATRDSVTYTHSCAVPLDGEKCENCLDAAPICKVTSGYGTKSLTLSAPGGGTIYYTTDGSTPTTSSQKYTGALTFSQGTTVKAIAVSGNYNKHRTMTYKVTIPPVATPTGSVTSGLSSGNTVASGAKITLSTTTSGAALYYTIDGSTPTTSSTKYVSPITITKDTTIKVIGVAYGCTPSSVATLTYKLGQSYTITASAGTGGSISPSGSKQLFQGGSQSYTITAGSGYQIADVKVDGKSVGAVSSYSFTGLSGNHTIAASFKVKSVSLPFTDVTSSQWFYSAVNYVYGSNLFKGVSDTSFAPNISMSRGMFITALGRMAGEEEFSGNIGIVTGNEVRLRSAASTSSTIVATKNKHDICLVLGSTQSGGYTWYKVQSQSKTGYIRGDYFKAYTGGQSDLGQNKYYNGYAQWAYLTGILNGATADSFGGDNAISRENMALILYNYSNKYGLTLPSTTAKASFSDDSRISSDAKRTAVYALQQAGVISGMGDGSYSPLGAATRAQVAQIFMNFKNAVK